MVGEEMGLLSQRVKSMAVAPRETMKLIVAANGRHGDTCCVSKVERKVFYKGERIKS